MGPRAQLGLAVAHDVEEGAVGLNAGARHGAEDEADRRGLVHEAKHFLGIAQGLFDVLETLDVEVGSGEADGAAPRVAGDHFALAQYPSPGAIAGAQAQFGLEEGRLPLEVRPHLGSHTRVVIGVNEVLPVTGTGLDIAQFVTEHTDPSLVVDDVVPLDVPIPEAEVSAEQRELKALFGLAEHPFHAPALYCGSQGAGRGAERVNFRGRPGPGGVVRLEADESPPGVGHEERQHEDIGYAEGAQEVLFACGKGSGIPGYRLAPGERGFPAREGFAIGHGRPVPRAASAPAARRGPREALGNTPFLYRPRIFSASRTGYARRAARRVQNIRQAASVAAAVQDSSAA